MNKPGGLGGYIFPSTSRAGPHVHRCSLGTLSMTEGICFPHPHHDTFLHLGQSARMHMMAYDRKRAEAVREKEVGYRNERWGEAMA